MQKAIVDVSTAPRGLAAKTAPNSAPTRAGMRSVQFKKASKTGVGGETVSDDPAEVYKPKRCSHSSNAPEFMTTSKPSVGTISRPELLKLEAQMRVAVRSLRRLHETELQVLLRAMVVHDDGSGTLQVPDFVEAWRTLKVDVTWEQALAVFRKHDTTASGALRFTSFANALLQGASRAISKEPVCTGYPVRDEDFKRKIVYPKCRKGVLAPSDFNLAMADRSTFLPDADLQLSFVYGYGGTSNTAPNMFYTCTGEVVYYTAAVCVVYDIGLHSQRFFLKHTDDIKCLAICPVAVTYAGEEYPARSLVVTGQVKPTEDASTEERECPFVIIWDVRTCKEVVRIVHDEADRAVVAAAFSPAGNRLTTVTCDDSHTVRVWAWKTRDVGAAKPSGKVVGLAGTGKGYKERPVAVYGVVWNPFSNLDQFATHGIKHLKVWAEINGRWLGTTLKFGKHKIDNVLSCVFLPPKSPGDEGSIVTGMPSGKLYLWRGGQVVLALAAHGTGPEIVTPEGSVTFGGVRCLKLRADNRTLLSGGADGIVHSWEVTNGKLGNKAGPGHALRRPGMKGSLPALRALDSHPGSDVFVAGTSCCDVWEVDADPEVLVHGHAGSVLCVACHPSKPHLLVSVDDKGHVFVWNANMRTLVRSCAARFACRACAVSEAALGASAMDDTPSHHIAVGGAGGAGGSGGGTSRGAGGRLVVLDEATLNPLYHDDWPTSAVSVLKYSPDNRLLAAGSHDTCVHIYGVRGGKKQYQRMYQCRGHSSTVTQLDWSQDSSVLMSNDQSYEILCWEAGSGRKTVHSQHNQAWHTWTCTLGFPVMGIWKVTGDDNSCVRLFNHPCVVESAPCHVYRGHSSHVTCVRFTCDDRRVVSSGGVDCALFVFETHAVVDEWEWRRGKRVTLPCKNIQCRQQRCVACGELGPVPLPPKVWGPLDQSGKRMGWVQPPRALGQAMENRDADSHIESDVFMEDVDH
eukprot:CAMPEP_0114273362 /NCGR_PEP_ID=MMETSP0058-20121206/29060_1 /TAXON_ID=36894 /ORGANISM="Pyramimonas parkeae, CCMP726" /LENGTH=967 /DNA_ID=CAMNT_0001392819 /DNA_START=317 /DNA_END=3220 /DNA_ORIENTATION=+